MDGGVHREKSHSCWQERLEPSLNSTLILSK